MCDLETREQFTALGNTEVLEEQEEGDIGTEDEIEEYLNDDDSREILECAHYRKYSKKDYFPIAVEDMKLVLNSHAEAFSFCSSLPSDRQCPFIFSLRKLPGDLLSDNGTVSAASVCVVTNEH